MAGIAEAATRAGATRARSFMLWCGVEDGVGKKAVSWDKDSFSTAGGASYYNLFQAHCVEHRA